MKTKFLKFTFLLALQLAFCNLFANATMLSAEIPEPPHANPALFVSSAQFTANWTAVEGADYYELDVIEIRSGAFLPGYDNMVVYGMSVLVTGTIPGKRYQYVVRAVNEGGESENSNTIVVAPIKNLTLRGVCSNNPALTRQWKIINNNPFPVDVKWRMPNTPQSGAVVAAPGETFITTQTIPGINYMLITWYDDKLIRHSSLKTSASKPCETPMAREASEDEEKGEGPSFTVRAYPVPITDRFYIDINAQEDGDVEVQMLNTHGQRLLNTKVKGNTSMEIDATSYAPGLYLIKAQQKNNVRILKVIR